MFRSVRMVSPAAGVGDEDVDRPELSLDPDPHRLDFGVGGDVGGHPDRTAAVTLDLALHRDAGSVPGDRRTEGERGNEGRMERGVERQMSHPERLTSVTPDGTPCRRRPS
jgi:hypothetical protein